MYVLYHNAKGMWKSSNGDQFEEIMRQTGLAVPLPRWVPKFISRIERPAPTIAPRGGGGCIFWDPLDSANGIPPLPP